MFRSTCNCALDDRPAGSRRTGQQVSGVFPVMIAIMQASCRSDRATGIAAARGVESPSVGNLVQSLELLNNVARFDLLHSPME